MHNIETSAPPGVLILDIFHVSPLQTLDKCWTIGLLRSRRRSLRTAGCRSSIVTVLANSGVNARSSFVLCDATTPLEPSSNFRSCDDFTFRDISPRLSPQRKHLIQRLCSRWYSTAVGTAWTRARSGRLRICSFRQTSSRRVRPAFMPRQARFRSASTVWTTSPWGRRSGTTPPSERCNCCMSAKLLLRTVRSRHREWKGMFNSTTPSPRFQHLRALLLLSARHTDV
jgi:hypothetical protein